MAIEDYHTWTSAEIGILEEKQRKDFSYLKEALINYFNIESSEYWKAVAVRMQDVLDSCDTIDYKEPETADAYAIWHLLDRYHRFQIMQVALLKSNLTNHLKNRPINILDVGTGPAPALFAFSDYYRALNALAGEEIYKCEEDYVEQSNGFRMFLHRFCELSWGLHSYSVPFHHGSFENFRNLSFEQRRRDIWDEWYTQKYRFDIALFSNFFTTTSTVSEFRNELIHVCRVMRKHGLILVVGACDEKSKKYIDVYKACDEIIARRFRNWKFYGWWRKIIQREFTYNYADEYGKEMRHFYSTIREQFKNSDTLQYVSEKARKNLEGRIANTRDKIINDSWQGLSWKMTVYQKKVWPTDKIKKR